MYQEMRATASRNMWCRSRLKLAGLVLVATLAGCAAPEATIQSGVEVEDCPRAVVGDEHMAGNGIESRARWFTRFWEGYASVEETARAVDFEDVHVLEDRHLVHF